MTLEKAIEIMEACLMGGVYIPPDPAREAVQLGIEALKRCKLLSQYHPKIDWQNLPSETKEIIKL